MYATLHIYRFQRTCSDCALIQKLLMGLREKNQFSQAPCARCMPCRHADMSDRSLCKNGLSGWKYASKHACYVGVSSAPAWNLDIFLLNKLTTTPLLNPCMRCVFLLSHVMKDPFEIYISTSGSFVGGRLCRHIGFNSKLTQQCST